MLRNAPSSRRGPALATAPPTLLLALICAGAASYTPASAATQDNGSDESAVNSLKSLSLDELMNTEVTSVSRTAQPLGEAAAAVYVITHDAIMRSGRRTLPEILRLAPNLQVARIDSDYYAISARGFNSSLADKLLVLIDGRIVYTPLFSGVFWDTQAVLPEDIDRIEVISGPGATQWGPNAVNGVINIITRNAHESQGGVVALGGGNYQDTGGMRYGGGLGADGAWRLYGLGSWLDGTHDTTGAPSGDSVHLSQGGFRTDWSAQADAFTVQGDAYTGKEEVPDSDGYYLRGENLLGRWTRTFSATSQLQVQAYFDRWARDIEAGDEDADSNWDLDIQHSFAPDDWNSILWGGSYQLSQDHFRNTTPSGIVLPPNRSLSESDAFLQDTMALGKSVKLTLGSKFETNSYTGFEPMPSVRLAWDFAPTQLLWAAISHAVRTPSRIDRDVYENAGPVVLVGGGPDFKDEKLTAYELGWRGQLGPAASVSISTFYNDYHDLRSFDLSSTGSVPLQENGVSGFAPILFQNRLYGHTYGVEAWGEYTVTGWWRLSAAANWLDEHLSYEPGTLDIGGLETDAGNDPSHQLSLGSSFELPYALALDLHVRSIGALPSPTLPDYTEADASLTWQATRNLQLTVTGSNLLHPQHTEFNNGSPPREIPRQVLVLARLTL